MRLQDVDVLNQLGEVAKELRLVSAEALFEALSAQRMVRRLVGRDVTIAEVLLIQRALGVESLRTAIRETEARALAASAKSDDGGGDSDGDAARAGGEPASSAAAGFETTPMRTRALFGQIALSGDYITEEQLLTALGVQQEDSRRGQEQPLGVVLGRLGFITKDEMREIMSKQFGKQPS